jgi:hypothetical protein
LVKIGVDILGGVYEGSRMSAGGIRSVTEGEFPANGSSRQKLEFALKYAALAPAAGTWQSWDFRVAEKHLELVAKDDPALAAIDPEGRELMIGCGAALLYLNLALKHFGCLGRVALFPDLGEPALVARVHFGFCRERDTQEKLLFKAMAGSRADVSPKVATPVSETMLAALSHAVAGERGWLDFVQSEMSRQHVLKITLAKDRHSTHFDRSRARPASTAAGGHTSRWPLPFFDFGGRDVDSWNVAVAPVRQPSVPAATLAIVKTKTDDKRGWLEAGQTMARTVLQAQSLGLSWAFFHPVRRREMREALRMRVGHKGFAQVILRFGSLTAGEMVQLTVPGDRHGIIPVKPI